jgi:voltage-gated potassium channel Kch
VPMRLTRFGMQKLERALETGRILRYLMLVIVSIAVASALIMRIVDPHDFPSLGLALWWAVTTVTTVGYGDVVPVQPAGRAVAAVLMITGFASLSLLTGIIASVLVHRQTKIPAPPPSSEFEQFDRRLLEIERRLGELLQRRAD